MAQVNIFEMGDLNERMPVRRVPFAAQQPLTSSPSSAFSGTTRYVSVQSDTDIFVKFSAAGTAATTATDYKIAAGETHDFRVNPGDKMAWTV